MRSNQAGILQETRACWSWRISRMCSLADSVYQVYCKNKRLQVAKCQLTSDLSNPVDSSRETYSWISVKINCPFFYSINLNGFGCEDLNPGLWSRITSSWKGSVDWDTDEKIQKKVSEKKWVWLSRRKIRNFRLTRFLVQGREPLILSSNHPLEIFKKLTEILMDAFWPVVHKKTRFDCLDKPILFALAANFGPSELQGKELDPRFFLFLQLVRVSNCRLRFQLNKASL